jgi:hypothetical protein
MQKDDSLSTLFHSEDTWWLRREKATLPTRVDWRSRILWHPLLWTRHEAISSSISRPVLLLAAASQIRRVARFKTYG